MTPYKKLKIGVMLGGVVAGFIGLLAALAILHPSTASARAGYNMACELCHTQSAAIAINTDITGTKTVAPGSSFAVNITWSGGGSITEISWPSVQSNSSFVGTTPLIAYSGTNKSGSASSTLTAPAATGTYVIRVYASTVSPWITNFKEMTIVVATPVNYSISASASPSAGGTVAGAGTYASGATVTLTASANTGYTLVNWTEGATSVSTSASYSFTASASRTLVANFAINTYTLTYTAGANGSLSGTTSQTVNYNASGTAVTAVPNTGYHFVNWSDSSTQNPRTDINVTASKSVTANFAINTYTLTYTPGANGSITGTLSQTVNYGASGTAVTAVPNSGYHFVNWSDGSTVNPRTDASVTANVAVAANFAADSIPSYTLTYTAGANGSLTGSLSQTVVSGGSGTAVTAVPNTGYHFVSWSDSSTQNPRTDTSVTADKSVTANFAINTYTLTYTAVANGSITGTLSQTVNYGASGTAVTAVPNTGYHFVSWSDSSTQNPRTDTNVTANKSVTASFAADTVTTYTIAASAGANGSITPSGSVVVNSGANQPFSIAPASGYVVSGVLVDGSSVGPVSTYTFTGVNKDHTIAASFAVETHTITASAGANGSITPGTVTVNHDATVTFTITADTGYHVDTITVDSSALATATATTTSTTYTFTNVTSSHTISATFAADTVPVLDTVGPVTTSVKISPKINKRTSPTSVTLSAVIDDAATGGSTIAGAEYFVDGVGPNGTGHQMSPATTAIASPTVTESATIDLLGLTAGRHIIYVHGRDSAGNWGPTARIRFRVVISTSPSSSPKRIAMTGQLSGNSDDDRDDAEEIEVDENSKGDVIQIVDHLSSGQDIILWPDNSSDYSDSE